MLFKLAGERDIGITRSYALSFIYKWNIFMLSLGLIMLFSCYALGLDPSTSSPIQTSDFGIGLEQLTAMTRDNNLSALEQYGGVSKSFISFYPFAIYNVNRLHNIAPFRLKD